MPKFYNPYTGQYEELYPGEDYKPGAEGYGTAKSYIKSSKATLPGRISSAQQKRFKADLARYDIEAQKYRDELMRAFGQETQTGVGLAQRGTMAAVNQALARRGIDTTRGGYGLSLTESTQARLQGQALQSRQNFSTRLYEVMQSQRDAFVRGEFDFFRRIDAMGYEAQLQKDLLRFQQEIRSDLSFRDMFNSTMSLGGAVVGGILFGPAGAVAGTAIGAGAQADEYGIA